MQNKEVTGKKEVTDKTNEEREQELQRRMADVEAEEAKTAKLFDPRELLLEAKAMRQKYHKKLGLVNYSVLTFDDMLSLGKIEDKDERTKTTLWMMLNKAYPDLRKEDVGRFPGTKVADLLTLMTRDEGFLPSTLKPASSGSKTTKTRK